MCIFVFLFSLSGDTKTTVVLQETIGHLNHKERAARRPAVFQKTPFIPFFLLFEQLTFAYCPCDSARQILPVVTLAVRRGGGPHAAPSPEEEPPKLAYIPLCGYWTVNIHPKQANSLSADTGRGTSKETRTDSPLHSAVVVQCTYRCCRS